MRCIVITAVLVVFYACNKCIAIKRCSKIDECRCSTDQGVINLWSLRGDSHKPRFNVSGYNASSASSNYIWSPCIPWSLTSNASWSRPHHTAYRGCTNVSVCQIKKLDEHQINVARDIGEQQFMDCVIETGTSPPSCILQYGVKSNLSITKIVLQCDTSQTIPKLDPFGSDYDQDIFPLLRLGFDLLGDMTLSEL